MARFVVVVVFVVVLVVVIIVSSRFGLVGPLPYGPLWVAVKGKSIRDCASPLPFWPRLSME